MPVTCKVDCPRCSEPIELEVELTLGGPAKTVEVKAARFVEVKSSIVDNGAIDAHLKACQNSTVCQNA